MSWVLNQLIFQMNSLTFLKQVKTETEEQFWSCSHFSKSTFSPRSLPPLYFPNNFKLPVLAFLHLIFLPTAFSTSAFYRTLCLLPPVFLSTTEFSFQFFPPLRLPHPPLIYYFIGYSISPKVNYSLISLSGSYYLCVISAKYIFLMPLRSIFFLVALLHTSSPPNSFTTCVFNPVYLLIRFLHHESSHKEWMYSVQYQQN